MVPEITHPKSISRALNYNENKVQKEQAKLIYAGNFLKNPEELNFHDKLERFQNQMELNDRAKTKVIHVSLNFHPSETERMTPEFLQQLSREYMEKMGFANQPYLVYQHLDAAHPHVHIVSTLIKEDGSRIPTHNLGRDVSEPVRKGMELSYGLVRADKKEYARQQEQHLAVNPQKVQAGKTDVKRGIQNVLDHVIDQYKYSSLQELNAVLKLYNVQAGRGDEEGRVYKNRGLLYAVIDGNDKKVAKPIKASVFYSKPTLDHVESRFEKNGQAREPDKKHVKNAIDWAMQKNHTNLGELAEALIKDRIDLVVRRNPEGRVYGLTYVDHEKKTVFNGSDLGKDYSAKRMLERLGIEQKPELDKTLTPEQQQSQQGKKSKDKDQAQQPEKNQQTEKSAEKEKALPPKQKDIQLETGGGKEQQPSIADSLGNGMGKLLQGLLQPDEGNESLNSELKKDEEKRRKRRNQEREQ